MKKLFLLIYVIVLNIPILLYAQNKVCYTINPSTGAIDNLTLENDKFAMKWLVATDGSQYDWIKSDYGWGLGYLTATVDGNSHRYHWNKPSDDLSHKRKVTYKVGAINIVVNRQMRGDDLIEEYLFVNTLDKKVSLSEIGIYTPLNDNYPDAATCLTNRTNAHIWGGENAAYISAIRMGGAAPHLGLVIVEGSIKGYEIFERGISKHHSQIRGIFAMKVTDMVLDPRETKAVTWKIFAHSGVKDFKSKLLACRSVLMESDKYVYEQGDTAQIAIRGNIKNGLLICNGVKYKPIKRNNLWHVLIPMNKTGEARVELRYGNGKVTHVDCLVLSNIAQIIKRRADFIVKKQQMMNVEDARYGAYMIYDNEGDSIYLNNTPNCNPPDRDEGRERVGMGVFLAKYYQLNPCPEVKKSLLCYAQFIRNKLQTEDYTTYSTTDHKSQNRGYNYSWVATFYFQMFKITGDKIFARYGYNTLQALFRHFGHGFYCIEMPVQLGLESLKDAGYEAEYNQLRSDYIKTGDVYIKNHLNYPKHEVNYEQSIVAPAIHFLLQLYQVTNDAKYFNEVKRQMPILETFNGFQPSFHLNDISIRHWDGFWFGKNEMFGDTFPHHWSTITAAVFYYYAQCIGESGYMDRAKNIVRNNLCLFTEDGRGSCAYLYPEKVDGKKGAFYDQYANDQDWALNYYLLVNNDLK